jgi:hypothetical protein
MEALQRLLFNLFEQTNPKAESISADTLDKMKNPAKQPSMQNLQSVEKSGQFLEYFGRYQSFTEDVQNGRYGKTAAFWLQYIKTIQNILMFIQATKQNDFQLHIASLYSLCPLFFAFDHTNYARYIPVYLMTMMNLNTSHEGSLKLLARKGFSSQDQMYQAAETPLT